MGDIHGCHQQFFDQWGLRYQPHSYGWKAVAATGHLALSVYPFYLPSQSRRLAVLLCSCHGGLMAAAESAPAGHMQAQATLAITQLRNVAKILPNEGQ